MSCICQHILSCIPELGVLSGTSIMAAALWHQPCVFAGSQVECLSAGTDVSSWQQHGLLVTLWHK